jgi:hypothetical protein
MRHALLMLMAWLVMSGGHHTRAHELRPGYLELRQAGSETFAVFWKVPARDDLRLGLSLQLPNSCTPTSEPLRVQTADAYTERTTLACRGDWRGGALPSTASRPRSPMCSYGWCGWTERPRASA